MSLLNMVVGKINDYRLYRKASKLADALVACNIWTHVIDAVDGKIVLIERSEEEYDQLREAGII